MNKSSLWRDAKRWLPGLVISVIALIILFRLVNWNDLKDALSRFSPFYILLALLLLACSMAVRAQAWRILLDHKPDFKRSFFIINEGYLLNNIFPLRAGELGRAIFMGRATGLSPFFVLSTIVIERVFDLAIAAGLLLSTLPLALGLEWAKPVAWLTLGLMMVMVAVMFFAARYNATVKGWMEKLAGQSALLRKWVLPRIDSLISGLGILNQPSKFFPAVSLIFLSWVLWVATHILMIENIAPGAPLWWGVLVDAVLAMGVAIPSAPSALGVFEASVVGAMSLLGISNTTALAYAIVMHFINFVVPLIFGGIGLFLEGKSLTSAFSEVRAAKEA